MTWVWALCGAAALAGQWPSLEQPPPAERLGAADAAVVVGIEDYVFVDDIAGAVANANDWYGWLVKTRGLPMSNVHILRNAEATREQLLDEAEWLAGRVGSGGVAWFVFIGHGAPNATGVDGLLVGSDAQQTAKGLYARSVPQSEILDLILKGQQSETMLVLDACFSGKSGGGQALVSGLQPMIPTRVMKSVAATIMTAGRSDQFAGPLPQGDRPAFSYLVLGALRGWGDADQDGQVTASEAVAYAEGALSGMLTTRSQTPQIRGPGERVGLSKGSEKGPDLYEMVRDGGSTSPTGPGDLGAELSRLKTLEAEAARLRAAMDKQAAAERARIQGEATKFWLQVEQMLDGEDETARAALTGFLDHYGQIEVEIGGERFGVDVKETALARTRLAELDDQWLSPSLGFRMTRIKAGSFTMGSPDGEVGRERRETQHRETINSAFWLSRYEVTQAEWEKVIGSNPVAGNRPDGRPCDSKGERQGKNLPVMCVSWIQAAKFANKLSEREGLTPAYTFRDVTDPDRGRTYEDAQWNRSANGYRLPTSAEWEYAARAGHSGTWGEAHTEADVCKFGNVYDEGSWKDRPAGDKFAAKQRYACDDGALSVSAVGSYQANAWGLSDMIGNAHEFTWEEDQSGSKPNRTYRGGSYRTYRTRSRLAHWSWNPPSKVHDDYGVRLARSDLP